MSFDIATYLGGVTRVVRGLEKDGQPARAVVATMTYDTDTDDLWDALTNAERLPRWFLPVSGDLKLGGRYQFQGNAGGTITSCDAPRQLAATWEFGGGVTWVTVTLTPDPAGGTQLQLEHLAPLNEFWDQYGPGAVGVGWDLGLMALGSYLQTGVDLAGKDPGGAALAASPEGKRFITACAQGWGQAAIASGEDAENSTAAAERTRKFYTGEA